MSDRATVEVLTAAEAEAAQRRVAGALASAGLGPGDRVAFCLPSSAALLCAVLGALRIGVVPVLLNATLLEAERDVLLADAEPALVVDRRRTAWPRWTPATPVELAPHPLARPMHYTSGTTGRSKGVWSGLWTADEAAAAFADEADLWSFGPDDVHLVCSPDVPLGVDPVRRRDAAARRHLRRARPLRRRGGRATLLAGRRGPTPTTTFMAPAALSRLLATAAAVADPVRLAAPAGPRRVALPPDAQAAGPRPGAAPGCCGSSTAPPRASSPCARPRSGRPVRAPSAGPGRAAPCRWTTTAPSGAARPASPGSATGGTTAKTASAWRDGAFTVGDLGRLDDGRLPVPRRPPGRPDHQRRGQRLPGRGGGGPGRGGRRRRGRRVRAARRPLGPAGLRRGGGWSPGPGRPPWRRRVAATPRRHLAAYKRPKQYVVLDALPRTATGKVQRNLIPGLVGRADPAGAAGRRSRRPRRRELGDTGRMSPVDAGPPIATVNPATGELLAVVRALRRRRRRAPPGRGGRPPRRCGPAAPSPSGPDC